MQKYPQILSTPVPQSQPQYPEQVPNSAGGFSFEVTHWQRLSRFLVLGTVGGTYYIGEQDLTKQSVAALDRCIDEDSERVVREIVAVSQGGRALKTDPAIFALAKCAVADEKAKATALRALGLVCRIPTHLFHFVAYYEALGGKWGRQLRSQIGYWYVSKEPRQLAYHLFKYQTRDGWSNKDLIKLSHPYTEDPDQHFLFARELGKDISPTPSHEIGAYATAVEAMHSKDVSLEGKVELIKRHKLTREMIPTELFNTVQVWEAMLPDIPTTALVRNLPQLTRLGLIGPMSQWNATIVAKLTSEEALRRSRIHPLQMLLASRFYEQGTNRHFWWRPESIVLRALQEGFYKSFGNVQPSNKRVLFALDESGSMGAHAAGDVPLTCAEAGAAFLCVMNSVEPQCATLNFATSVRRVHYSNTSRLEDVMREYRCLGEGTDCAQPILWALHERVPVDVFVIFTDSESWAGNRHAQHALDEYRKVMGIASKVVTCAAVGNGYSVFRNDPLSLDVPGFDASLPQIVREFALI